MHWQIAGKSLLFILSFRNCNIEIAIHERVWSNSHPCTKTFVMKQVMIFPFETVNPQRKKSQKNLSFRKRLSDQLKKFENFGATLQEIAHRVFYYAKHMFSLFISRTNFL